MIKNYSSFETPRLITVSTRTNVGFEPRLVCKLLSEIPGWVTSESLAGLQCIRGRYFHLTAAVTFVSSSFATLASFLLVWVRRKIVLFCGVSSLRSFAFPVTRSFHHMCGLPGRIQGRLFQIVVWFLCWWIPPSHFREKSTQRFWQETGLFPHLSCLTRDSNPGFQTRIKISMLNETSPADYVSLLCILF